MVGLEKRTAAIDTETFYRIIPSERVPIYQFYKCVFQDGVPMKMDKRGTLVFHPIYPSYCIQELEKAYHRSKRQEYLQMAHAIFMRSTRFLQSFHGSSVFMYRPSDGLVNIGYPFFSALTQAQYLYSAALIFRLLKDEMMLPFCESIYHSFRVPQKDGGVLLKFDFGSILEEYHSNPPLFTLNGFMTAIQRLYAVRDVISLFDKDVDHFLRDMVNGLEHILPLYDCAVVCNSRYNLSGFRRLRIVLHHKEKENPCQIKKAMLAIPGLGSYDVALEKSNRRFDNYIESSDNKKIQFNLVMSMFSYPKRNVLDIVLQSACDCRYEIYLSEGDYDPLLTSMPTSRWAKIREGELHAGENILRIELPFDGKNLFAYPTNFKKLIKGVHYNAYHFLHIKDLVLLYEYTGDSILREYASKFYGYSKKWPEMDIYAKSGGGGISLTAHPCHSVDGYRKYF